MRARTMSMPSALLVDPAFAYLPDGLLSPRAACDPQEAWRYLSSLVARDALDVEAHARRVVLAVSQQSAGQSLTALLDLFLALGASGRALRSELLAVAAPLLSDEDVAFFHSALSQGLPPDGGLPLGAAAVLDPGLMGARTMIVQSRAQAREESLAEQAAALIDQGDLSAAQALLEAGLLDNPGDAAATRELIAIYRHSRDSEAEAQMRQRLRDRHGVLPQGWQ